MREFSYCSCLVFQLCLDSCLCSTGLHSLAHGPCGLHATGLKPLVSFANLLLRTSSTLCAHNTRSKSHSAFCQGSLKTPGKLSETGRVPNLRFGVEFEFLEPLDGWPKLANDSAWIPEYLSRDPNRDFKLILEKVQRYVAGEGIPITNDCGASRLDLEVGNEYPKEQCWHVLPDYNLEFGDRGPCIEVFEINSPIIGDYSGLRKVKGMCQTLQQMGVTLDYNCGFHVHIDASNIDGEHMSSLLLLHRCLEQDCGLVDCFNSSRRDNGNCKDTSDELIAKAREDAVTPEDAEKFQASREPDIFRETDTDKYRSLNIFTQHGTVEFKRMEGSLSYHDVLSWVVTCLFTVSAAKTLGRHFSTTDLREAFKSMGMFEGGELAAWSANYMLARQAASRDSSKLQQLKFIRSLFHEDWLHLPDTEGYMQANEAEEKLENMINPKKESKFGAEKAGAGWNTPLSDEEKLAFKDAGIDFAAFAKEISETFGTDVSDILSDDESLGLGGGDSLAGDNGNRPQKRKKKKDEASAMTKGFR